MPRIRILFAKWVALANKIRQYYEDIENCSYFIRHSVAMALLMRTKNEQKNECVPKVDKLRIPFVKWLPGHLYGEQKKMLRFLFANGVPGQQKCEHMAIKGRIRKLVALLSHFVRPRVAQAI